MKNIIFIIFLISLLLSCNLDEVNSDSTENNISNSTENNISNNSEEKTKEIPISDEKETLIPSETENFKIEIPKSPTIVITGKAGKIFIVHAKMATTGFDTGEGNFDTDAILEIYLIWNEEVNEITVSDAKKYIGGTLFKLNKISLKNFKAAMKKGEKFEFEEFYSEDSEKDYKEKVIVEKKDKYIYIKIFKIETTIYIENTNGEFLIGTKERKRFLFRVYRIESDQLFSVIENLKN